MSLDIARRERLLRLLDLYSNLLTEHQGKTMRLYLEKDWSYAEIAAGQGVSRTAIYDLVHRAETALQEYESKLGLLARGEQRRDAGAALAARVEDLEQELKSLKRAVKELA
jgi:predicted DNA-binding protein YlxM (UPF0122 family)